VTYGPQPPPPCMLCGSTDNVRHFQIVVDGDPLRLQPFLCSDHGDAYLLRVGAVLGGMMRDSQRAPVDMFRESGDSFLNSAARRSVETAHSEGAPDVEAPVLNKSGGSSVIPPCPHALIVQVPQLADGRLTGRYDRTCADCGQVIERGAEAR
jgi:hypothetical protein